jgi:hypothetical protein
MIQKIWACIRYHIFTFIEPPLKEYFIEAAIDSLPLASSFSFWKSKEEPKGKGNRNDMI